MHDDPHNKLLFQVNQMSNTIPASTAEPIGGLLQSLNIGIIRPLALNDQIVSADLSPLAARWTTGIEKRA